MNITIKNAMPQGLSHIGRFTQNNADMQLVDLIGDARFFFKSNMLKSPGSWVYRLDLTIDGEKLRESNIVGFELQVFKQNPDIMAASKLNISVEDIVGAEAELSAAEAAQIDDMFSCEIDIMLDYREAVGLAYLTPRSKGFKTKKVFSSQTPEELNRLSSLTVYEAKQYLENLDPDLDFAEMAQKLAAQGGDPLSILDSDENLGQSAQEKAGLDSIANMPFGSDVVRIPSYQVLARQSLVDYRKKANQPAIHNDPQALQLQVLASGDQTKGSTYGHVLGYMYEVYNEKFRVVRDIEIPIDKIAPSSYCRLVPIMKDTTSDFIPQFTTWVLQHDAKLQNLLVPQVKPRVRIQNQFPGQLKIRVESIDPFTSTVVMARKVYNVVKEEFIDDLETSFTLEFSDNQQEVVTDLVDSCFPFSVRYYAMVQLPNGAYTLPTGLTVPMLQGFSSAQITTPHEKDTTIMMCYNASDKIFVLVSNIPKEASHIRIGREDMSFPGDLRDRTTFLSINPLGPIGSDDFKNTYFKVDQDKQITAQDFHTSIGTTYRYFAVIRRGGIIAGSPVIGGDYLAAYDEIIKRQYPTTPLPVQIEISEVSQGPDSSVPTSQFVISVTINQSGYSYLQNQLHNEGISEMYQKSFVEKPDMFTPLIRFLVTRIDKVTGEKKEFPIVGAGTFLDGGGFSEDALKPGRSYIYLVNVLMVTTETFFTNLFGELNTGDLYGNKKPFLVSKFKNAVTKQFGILPSDADLAQDTPVDQLMKESFLGINYQLEFKTPKITAVPHSLTVSEGPPMLLANGDEVLPATVQWKIQGPLSEVYGSVVYAEHRGNDITLGTVPCIAGNRKYQYTDHNIASRPGKRKYYVRLMYNDFSLSDSSNNIIVMKKFNLNEKLVADDQGNLPKADPADHQPGNYGQF